MAMNKIETDSNWGAEAGKINQNFQSISTDLTKVKMQAKASFGPYKSSSNLPSGAVENATAWVSATLTPPFQVWQVQGGEWVNTGFTYTQELGTGDLATKEELAEQDAKLTELSSLYLLSGYSSQESTAVKNFQYFRVLIDIDITNLRIATIYNDSSIQKRIIIKTNDNADWKLINMTSNYYADSEIELYYDWEKHSNNVNNSGSSSCIAILESSKINKVIKENSKNIKNLYLISKNATFNVYSENNTENELKILSCFKQIRILGEYKDLCINTIYNSESIPKRIIIRTFDNSIQQTINFIENHYEGNTQLGYIIIDFDWDYFITNCININDIGNKYIIIKSDAFIDKLYENINDVEDIKGNIIIPETEEIQYDEIIQAYPNYVTGTFVVGTQVYAKTAVFAIQKNVEYVISGNTVGPTDSSYCSVMFTTNKESMKGTSLLNTDPKNIGADVNLKFVPSEDGYLFVWLFTSETVPYTVGKKIGDLYLPTENEKSIKELENRIDAISTEIQNKNLVILGDSIIMLMRTNSVPSNTITYQDDEGTTYDYSLLTNKNGHLYVTSTLQDGNVIENSKMVDIVNSSQAAFDSQNWDSLKQKLGVKNLYNFGLGGAMFAERQIVTSYPYPDDNGWTTDLPNEVRWLIRRYTEGNVEYPDCIIIWLGTNGAGEPSSDNYEEIMLLTYDELNSDEHYADRKTLYGGLRWSLETLYRTFQYATIILVTPVQTNPENYRTYDKLTTTANAIKKMAGRYSCMVFDALNEIGVVDFFEKSDGSGYFLSDGLHPKSAGKVLWKNYLSQKLISFYYSKR